MGMRCLASITAHTHGQDTHHAGPSFLTDLEGVEIGEEVEHAPRPEGRAEREEPDGKVEVGLEEQAAVEGEELHDEDEEGPAVPALEGLPREVTVRDGAAVRHQPLALDDDGRVERQEVVEEEVQVAGFGCGWEGRVSRVRRVMGRGSGPSSGF
jgi:hypothetical protein